MGSILLVIGFIFIAMVIIQIFLKKYKYAGLVLPAISLIISILISIPNFIKVFWNGFSFWAFVASVILLIVCNMPTAVMLLMYYDFRTKNKKNSEIDKMNIQDL
ncbi:MAG: hypothetical protein Q8865_03210 [Bacillota bacterium]|nr:hypothetical protein [Bacillota bacterium]